MAARKKLLQGCDAEILSQRFIVVFWKDWPSDILIFELTMYERLRVYVRKRIYVSLNACMCYCSCTCIRACVCKHGVGVR